MVNGTALNIIRLRGRIGIGNDETDGGENWIVTTNSDVTYDATDENSRGEKRKFGDGLEMGGSCGANMKCLFIYLSFSLTYAKFTCVFFFLLAYHFSERVCTVHWVYAAFDARFCTVCCDAHYERFYMIAQNHLGCSGYVLYCVASIPSHFLREIPIVA